MPPTKSPNTRTERVECVLTPDELTRLDALRGHETRSHYLLTRAGVRVDPATVIHAAPGEARSCAGGRHNLSGDWTCPKDAVLWAAEYSVPATDDRCPPPAPACPGRETP